MFVVKWSFLFVWRLVTVGKLDGGGASDCCVHTLYVFGFARMCRIFSSGTRRTW